MILVVPDKFDLNFLPTFIGLIWNVMKALTNQISLVIGK